MSRRFVRCALVVVLACACSRSSAPAAGEAKRVVSLGPSTTESLFAIGAGDRVVARSRFCDWPTEAASLPDVGGVQPDVEAILALAPDLVVGPSGAWSAPLQETLRARGIAAWFPAEIESLEGVDALLVGLGERTGHAAEARRVAAALDTREAVIARALAQLPKVRVLFVVGITPIVVAGPRSFADEMLRRAGGTNVVTSGGAWPALDFERVTELDPDVVVDAAEGSADGPLRIGPGVGGWAGVRAVREGHVVPIADERVLRPGPRVAAGLFVLARALHPAAVIP
jgi:iron complex transport system substrate-binding protein